MVLPDEPVSSRDHPAFLLPYQGAAKDSHTAESNILKADSNTVLQKVTIQIRLTIIAGNSKTV